MTKSELAAAALLAAHAASTAIREGVDTVAMADATRLRLIADGLFNAELKGQATLAYAPAQALAMADALENEAMTPATLWHGTTAALIMRPGIDEWTFQPPATRVWFETFSATVRALRPMLDA